MFLLSVLVVVASLTVFAFASVPICDPNCSTQADCTCTGYVCVVAAGAAKPLSGRCQKLACLPGGNQCDAQAQCCSKTCNFAAGGSSTLNVCANVCNSTCLSNADCTCDGYLCERAVGSGTPPGTCRQRQSTATTTAASTGNGGSPCKTSPKGGNACKTSADCCRSQSYTCEKEQGSKAAGPTCQSKVCGWTGDSCTTSSTCCPGYMCERTGNASGACKCTTPPCPKHS